jgi:hypothetical protein
MRRLTEKCLAELNDVEEGVIAEPEYKGKRVRALLKIDQSDEKNLSYSPRSDDDRRSQTEAEYFYMRNKYDIPTNLKRVEIKIDTETDVDENSEIHEAVRRRLNQMCCR